MEKEFGWFDQMSGKTWTDQKSGWNRQSSIQINKISD